MAKAVAMDDIELTIAYEETDEGQVIARIVEVPAAMSFAPTREEAREAALDALRELARQDPLRGHRPHPRPRALEGPSLRSGRLSGQL
jgi:predicted RNase H-like HicB family nuclease